MFSSTAREAGTDDGSAEEEADDEEGRTDFKTGKKKGVVQVLEIIIFLVSPSTCSSLT